MCVCIKQREPNMEEKQYISEVWGKWLCTYSLAYLYAQIAFSDWNVEFSNRINLILSNISQKYVRWSVAKGLWATLLRIFLWSMYFSFTDTAMSDNGHSVLNVLLLDKCHFSSALRAGDLYGVTQ